MIGQEADTAVITARLTEAARRRQPLEVIVVLRGRVRPAGGRIPGRWHVQVGGQRAFTFPAAAVVAATPITPDSVPGRRRARGRHLKAFATPAIEER